MIYVEGVNDSSEMKWCKIVVHLSSGFWLYMYANMSKINFDVKFIARILSFFFGKILEWPKICPKNINTNEDNRRRT